MFAHCYHSIRGKHLVGEVQIELVLRRTLKCGGRIAVGARQRRSCSEGATTLVPVSRNTSQSSSSMVGKDILKLLTILRL
jgi:hypothetical protein